MNLCLTFLEISFVFHYPDGGSDVETIDMQFILFLQRTLKIKGYLEGLMVRVR